VLNSLPGFSSWLTLRPCESKPAITTLWGHKHLGMPLAGAMSGAERALAGQALNRLRKHVRPLTGRM
jgi:hypothetical protein